MNKRILTYVIVSFIFSWAMAGLIWQLEDLGSILTSVIMFAYMCGPAVGALVCVWLYHKGERVNVLGLKPRWSIWLIGAYVIGIAIVLGATLISLASPKVGLQAPVIGYKGLMEAAGQNGAILDDIPYINVILIAQFLLLAPLLNIPLMLSEELGWRGWLWHELRPRGFWITSFWTGLLWGLWHVPIILLGHNYPSMPVIGAALFTLFCLLYAPVYSWIRERTGSVWGPCILHAAGNGSAAIGFIIVTNTDMPWRGVVGIGGFAMTALILALVYIWKRREGEKVNKAVTITD